MKIYFTIGFVLVSFGLIGQKGKLFPLINGITLDEKQIVLPIKNGKETIVAFTEAPKRS